MCVAFQKYHGGKLEKMKSGVDKSMHFLIKSNYKLM